MPKIYIDQGHNPSGVNTGAEGNGLREQDVTYAVGQELARLLRRSGNYEVRLSRNTPTEVLGSSNASSLRTRVQDANAWGADYFISIHTNRSTDPSAKGIEAYAEMSFEGRTCSAEYLSEWNPMRTEERVLKLAVGGAVISAAGELTRYRPAWGMLIGVRPSKVASEMLNAGLSKTKVKKLLNTDYMVIPKKAALATDIAVTEKRIVGESSFITFITSFILM